MGESLREGREEEWGREGGKGGGMGGRLREGRESKEG